MAYFISKVVFLVIQYNTFAVQKKGEAHNSA